MDNNLRQLLDEIYRRDSSQGLDLYAGRDAQSAEAVKEFRSDTIGVTTNTLQSPESDYTSRCVTCKTFWYPGEAIEKCPECGGTDIENFIGHISDFTELEGSGLFSEIVTKSNHTDQHTLSAKFKRYISFLTNKKTN